jgi:hypothetical protein
VRGQGREGGRARLCRSGEEGVCRAVGKWRSGEEGGASRDGVLRAGSEMVGEGGEARRLRCRRLSRFPENALGGGTNCKMQLRLQQPLDRVQ